MDSNFDERSEEDADTSIQGHITEPSFSLIESNVDETSRPKKATFNMKTNRKRQAEEDFSIIKGLAQSIAEKRSRLERLSTPATNPVESFSQYIAQSLSELDTNMRHLAQHKISEILVQAQNGTLTNDYRPLPTMQPQAQFFRQENIQRSSQVGQSPSSTVNSKEHIQYIM